MRRDIHPEYSEVKATCSCGNVIGIKTTIKEDINLDVCSSCHPFYTGKQKLVDTGGRVERFEKRFGKKSKAKTEKKEIAKESNEEEVSIEEPEQVAAEEKKTKAKAKTEKKKSANQDKKEDVENEDLMKDV
ncbi:MAG: 50S ribosomal protein L31 [Gammaproteobacteria bacterium]|nr:MAG: 50S ribosomal protein L31 [Gammaproteobacteria bacterium]